MVKNVIEVWFKIFALVFGYNLQGILATSASRKTQKKKKKKVRKGMFKEFESRKCILHSVHLQSDWVLELITQVKTVIIAGLNFFFHEHDLTNEVFKLIFTLIQLLESAITMINI